VEFFLAAATLRPRSAQTLSNLGGVLVQARRAEEAVGYLERALAVCCQ
jgi:Tfp pilus assembly protein PilF